jgi:hypothetical protein
LPLDPKPTLWTLTGCSYTRSGLEGEVPARIGRGT